MCVMIPNKVVENIEIIRKERENWQGETDV